MRKLLTANFARLWKNRVFITEIIATVMLSVWLLFVNYSSEIQASENRLYLEDVFFTMYQLLGFILAAGISLFVGMEYSDGTIRNKLIVGYSRKQIYFSNLLTAAASCCLVILAHGIVTFSIGRLFFGGFQIAPGEIIISVANALLTSVVYGAIFVCVTMNISNKAASAVVSLVLALGLLYGTSYLASAVMAPEMTYGTVTFTQNGVTHSDLMPNPAYISGIKRLIYELLYDLLPTGQLTQMFYLDFTRCARWPWLSALVFAATAMMGYGIFREIDIK